MLSAASHATSTHVSVYDPVYDPALQMQSVHGSPTVHNRHSAATRIPPRIATRLWRVYILNSAIKVKYCIVKFCLCITRRRGRGPARNSGPARAAVSGDCTDARLGPAFAAVSGDCIDARLAGDCTRSHPCAAGAKAGAPTVRRRARQAAALARRGRRLPAGVRECHLPALRPAVLV